MAGLSYPRLPTSGLTPEVRTYLEDLQKYITAQFKDRVPDLTGKASVLLVAPNGSVYTVAVDNTGAVVTTQVSG